MLFTSPLPLKSHSKHEKSAKNHPARTADMVLPSLTPELRQTLGILNNTPRGIAELTIATLELGSRLTLRKINIVEFDDNDLEATSLKITKLGRKIIAVCGLRSLQSTPSTPHKNKR